MPEKAARRIYRNDGRDRFVHALPPYGGGTKVMAEETLEKYFPNMDYVIGNGDGDPVTQSALIDDYIARGIDVLVIDPVEKEAMVPAFERLKEAGIPVVCVDRYVPADFESVVKADDVKIGQKAGEAMVELLGGQGKVKWRYKGAPAASNTNDRHIGFAQGIAGSQIEVIAAPYADFFCRRAASGRWKTCCSAFRMTAISTRSSASRTS